MSNMLNIMRLSCPLLVATVAASSGHNIVREIKQLPIYKKKKKIIFKKKKITFHPLQLHVGKNKRTVKKNTLWTFILNR